MAQQRDYLVFVEGRTKSNPYFGVPEESIMRSKKERLVSSALSYINTHKNLPPLQRIDVVAIEIDEGGKAKGIELIENALS